MQRLRLDQRLVDLGLAKDIHHAKGLILSGKVVVNDQLVTKAGFAVAQSDIVRFKSGYNPSRFVSRGGEKLWGAVQTLDLQAFFKDAVVLDVGASTGGFTDVAIQLGARRVYALDVGTNQLAWKLRQDHHVKVLEKTDIRSVKNVLDEEISLVLADISFNSLSNLLPAILAATPKKGVHFLLLVKPQFELPGDLIPDGGVVIDRSHQKRAIDLAKTAFLDHQLEVKAVLASSVLGREGNQEYFIFASQKFSDQNAAE